LVNEYFYLLAPIVLQIVFVVHAIKTGRSFIWVFAIVFLPLLGSLAYFAVEIVPDLFRSQGAQRFRTQAAAMADPNRSFREAKRAVEMTGSIDAKRALAEEYLRRGRYGDAIVLYREALSGQFHDDPALLMGLARAQFLHGDGAAAQAALDTLQAADPSFISHDAHLIYARALELQGKDEEALGEYARLIPYYPGEEARARYGLLLQKTGHAADAQAQFGEILKSLDGAPSHYRARQREWSEIARRQFRG
jgi:hypothetical protein